MTCPKCHNDGIPFRRVWARGGMGRFQCVRCGAGCRVRRSPILVAAAFALGGLAVVVWILLRSWLLFAVALVVALAIDAWIDSRFRRLDVADDAAMPNV